jgi:hypothetical protein
MKRAASVKAFAFWPSIRWRPESQMEDCSFSIASLAQDKGNTDSLSKIMLPHLDPSSCKAMSIALQEEGSRRLHPSSQKQATGHA